MENLVTRSDSVEASKVKLKKKNSRLVAGSVKVLTLKHTRAYKAPRNFRKEIRLKPILIWQAKGAVYKYLSPDLSPKSSTNQMSN